jgi:hypothetical protein
MNACDLLDPCKICSWIFRFICIAILFLIGGYAGKGIYIYENKQDIDTKDIFLDEEFFIPDDQFWLFGIASVVLLFVAVGLLRIISICITKILKYLFCELCCHCCCLCLRKNKKESYHDDYEMDLEDSIRKKMKNKGKKEYELVAGQDDVYYTY